MSEVCAHFEAINGKKNCRIGEPISQRCGYDCIAYYPDSERTPCEVWGRVQEHRSRKPSKEAHS